MVAWNIMKFSYFSYFNDFSWAFLFFSLYVQELDHKW